MCSNYPVSCAVSLLQYEGCGTKLVLVGTVTNSNGGALNQGTGDVLAVVGVVEVTDRPLIVLVNDVFQCECVRLGLLQGFAAVTPEKVAVFGYSGSFGILW
jgi:hypothetical protein